MKTSLIFSVNSHSEVTRICVTFKLASIRNSVLKAAPDQVLGNEFVSSLFSGAQ